MRILVMCLVVLAGVRTARANQDPAVFVPVKSVEATHAITLRVVHLARSRWTTSEMVDELEFTNQIFARCNVQIAQIQLLTLDLPADFGDFDDVKRLSAALETSGFRRAGEPVVLFAADVIGEFRSWGGNTAGFAINQLVTSKLTEEYWGTVNMAFVLERAVTKRATHRAGGYCPLAHELGHVFMNIGHVRFENLMGERSDLLNGDLTDDQCKTLREGAASLLK